MHGRISNEDREGFQRRLAMIERRYPGPKSAQFYEEIERGGFAIERPTVLRRPEHDARETLDQIAGRFVANGSYEEAFIALRPLVVGFEFGLLPDPSQALPDGKATRQFTAEEKRLYRLAKDIQSVAGELEENGPRILANAFSEEVSAQIEESYLGFSLNDVRFLADLERARERSNRNRDKGADDENGRLRSIQSASLILPLIFAWITNVA